MNTVNEHKYRLQPYKGSSTRHTCPSCGSKKSFARYVDSSGNQIADNVGRCNRETSCGAHYKPKDYFTDNPGAVQKSVANPTRTVVKTEIDYLPFETMDKSVSRCKESDLFPFLSKLFTDHVANELCKDYFVGTNKYGNTVFWQVDIKGNVRQCKIIKYNQDGRRDKETGVRFAGKQILKNDNANLKQCFFGEYLLSFADTNKPIAIVESEKTAIVASVFFQDSIWLATGGINGAKWTEQSVCNVLRGRKVILFPDLGAFDKWKSKSLLLAATAGCKVVVSDLLEREAREEDRKHGYDIADYLLRNLDSTGLAITDDNYPVMWDYTKY